MRDVAASSVEHGAFGEVLAAHGAAIARVAAAHENVKARRDELVQEMLLAIWQALPRFRGDASLKTFVLRVAHNKAVDHVLREKKHGKTEVLMEETPSLGYCLEAQMSHQQEAQRLLAAVQQLPLGQRELVALALEGCSHQEIAEIIGITVNNVAVRLSRARTSLNIMLESIHE